MVRWLIREEDIGFKNWKQKNRIVKLYNQNIENPFVNTNSRCGISKSDFEMMVFELKRKGIYI